MREQIIRLYYTDYIRIKWTDEFSIILSDYSWYLYTFILLYFLRNNNDNK